MSLDELYSALSDRKYFSCFIDRDCDTNGSVKFFQGGSLVHTSLLGPLSQQKNSDETGRNPI